MNNKVNDVCWFAWCRLCFGSMLKQTSMQRFFGHAFAYPCQIIVCSILVPTRPYRRLQVSTWTTLAIYNAATPCSMVYQVANVQVVVDPVAGSPVVDQVAGTQDSGVCRVGLKGVSKSRICKWLMKVGASNGVTPLIKKNHGRGGFPGNQKPPWIRHCRKWIKWRELR